MSNLQLDGHITAALDAIESALCDAHREQLSLVASGRPQSDLQTPWQARMDALHAVSRILKGAGIMMGGCRDLLEDAP